MLQYINPINWRLWQKLLLIIIVMGVVIIVSLRTLLPLHDFTIEFSGKEIDGCIYLTEVQKLLQDSISYRFAAVAALGGDTIAKELLPTLETRIDSAIKAIEAAEQKDSLVVQGKKLGESLQTSQTLSKLKKDWETVKGTPPSVETNLQRAKLVNDAVVLIGQAGDYSNLILDPDLDTYYLMAATIYQAPKLAEKLNSIQEISASVMTRKAITVAEKLQVANLTGGVQLANDDIQRGMTVSFGYDNPAAKAQGVDLGKSVAPVFDEYLRELAAFQQNVDQNFLKVDAISADAKQFSTNVDNLNTKLFKYYAIALSSLQKLIEIRVAKYQSDRSFAINAVIVGTILGLLIVAAISFLITRQVNVLQDTFESIKGGKYEARAKLISVDELGKIAVSLNSTLDTVQSLIQSREERDEIQKSILRLLDEVSTVADGNLMVEAEVKADITGAIADSFNFMIAELRRVIGDVQEVAVQVSSAADEIQSTMKSLAQGSESQSMQISDTSASIDGMAGSIRQVADTAATSTTVAEEALKTAQTGTKSVEKTIKSMDGIREQVQRTAKRIKRLGESSQEIGEIVQLIRDIADRTSILALNASIQAAMAGEAGRGFAVVAEEVERLADRSTEATKRIEALIKAIQTETNETVVAMEDMTREVVNGSEIANEAGKALEEIQGVSKRLAELIQTISLSARQQARTSDSLAKAVGEISTVTQQSAAGTKQAAVSVSNLASLAEGLLSSVSTFKISDNGKK
ncbi:MAG: methyl-accepting chemotaxis protein [Acidobacteria bacterium]|nr:methyl-accepting chemotaxis protein [Acidobacteriota bacterium]